MLRILGSYDSELGQFILKFPDANDHFPGALQQGQPLPKSPITRAPLYEQDEKLEMADFGNMLI
jgi:hypothetical protein